MLLYCAANLEGAFHRRFRCVVKNQRHPVAGRNRDQSMVRFGFAELLRAADNLVQLLEQSALLINQQLGVADYVDEKDIGDLKLNLLLNLRGHGGEILLGYERRLYIILSALTTICWCGGRRAACKCADLQPTPATGRVRPEADTAALQFRREGIDDFLL